MKIKRYKTTSSCWLNQPSWKILWVKMGKISFPNFGVKKIRHNLSCHHQNACISYLFFSNKKIPTMWSFKQKRGDTQVALQKSLAPYIWVFPKIMVPQNGWFCIWKTLLTWDDLGVPLFSETSIYGSGVSNNPKIALFIACSRTRSHQLGQLGLEIRFQIPSS